MAPEDHKEKPDTGFYNPTEITLKHIGGKWKTAILCLLDEQGPMRNGELMRNLAPITQKVLTEQLRELEKDRLISRTVHPEIPPKVTYELTGAAVHCAQSCTLSANGEKRPKSHNPNCHWRPCRPPRSFSGGRQRLVFPTAPACRRRINPS